MFTTLLTVVLTLQTPAAPPRCDAPEHRQFDFWVGKWHVTSQTGQALGTNVITKELDDCVIHEHWTGARGARGESFNIWDRTTSRWHQTWVSSTGALLLLDGEFRDGAMRLSGPSMNGTQKVMNRITWTRLPDGGVRQLWETSSDGGGTWTIAFDGLYRRSQ